MRVRPPRHITVLRAVTAPAVRTQAGARRSSASTGRRPLRRGPSPAPRASWCSIC